VDFWFRGPPRAVMNDRRWMPRPDSIPRVLLGTIQLCLSRGKTLVFKNDNTH